MSQHQQFLVPLRTLESTEKGPSAQSVHGDKPVTMFSGQVQGQVNTQNTKYGAWHLSTEVHVFLMVRTHCQIPAEKHNLKHLPSQHFQLCFVCYFYVDSFL